MAARTLSTTLSRRAILPATASLAAGTLVTATLVTGAAAGLIAPSATPGGGDRAVAEAAGNYRRACDALTDWIHRTESRFGPLACEEPEHRPRYGSLCDGERRAAAALARARAESIGGLVLKLRAGCYHDDLRSMVHLEGDDDILLAALHDLERIAENSGSGEPPP